MTKYLQRLANVCCNMIQCKVWVVLLVYLCFPLVNGQWCYITGNQSIDVLSDYTYPYPGSVAHHTMVLDSTNSYLYVFGGDGYDNSSSGTCYLLC